MWLKLLGVENYKNYIIKQHKTKMCFISILLFKYKSKISKVCKVIEKYVLNINQSFSSLVILVISVKNKYFSA